MSKVGDVGTLLEIGAQAGDVVAVQSTWQGCEVDNKSLWTIGRREGVRYYGMKPTYFEGHSGTPLCNYTHFRLISRATPQPKIWRDMTAEEKGALLLAAHEGKVIEFLGPMFKDSTFCENPKPAWNDAFAYRIKPEPKIEMVTQHWKTNKKGQFVPMASNHHDTATHCITFQTSDGIPDCASIKMEELSL